MELLISRLTADPARAYGLPAGRLRVGDAGDVTVFDPTAEWALEESKIYSKGKNTPLIGQRLVGKIVATAVAGKVVHADEQLVPRMPLGAGA
jgi:dihydroorotase